jgi:hypothetical protein
MKKVILISGHMRTGKNQFAKYLQKEFERKDLSVTTDLFAKTLKDWCKEDFRALSSVLENLAEQIKSQINLYSDTREHMMSPYALESIDRTVDKLKIRDTNWYEDKTDITRIILQLYGTNIFRNRVNDNWWVDQMRRRVVNTDTDIVIITDTRFPNEITGMLDDSYEIIAIRIERNINTQEQMASHPSETSLDGWKEWNYIVENNGTLEDLKDSAEVITNDIVNEQKEEILGLFTRQSKENIQWVNSLNS